MVCAHYSESVVPAAKMNLTGTIPVELDMLDSLQSISLPYNNLQGQLPDRMSHLKSLLSVDVDQNILSGTPMDALHSPTSTSASELAVLRLAYNSFEPWTIPSNIDVVLPNLQSLLLQGSSMTGSLPTTIGNLSLLRKCLKMSILLVVVVVLILVVPILYR